MAALTLYLADTSSWHRSAHPDVGTAWASRLAANSLATCAQVRLEILYSARSADDYATLSAELRAVPHGS